MTGFHPGARLGQSILLEPVTTLRGVGEKMASRLADIGIQSLEDLLFHFPLRLSRPNTTHAHRRTARSSRCGHRGHRPRRGRRNGPQTHFAGQG